MASIVAQNAARLLELISTKRISLETDALRFTSTSIPWNVLTPRDCRARYWVIPKSVRIDHDLRQDIGSPPNSTRALSC